MSNSNIKSVTVKKKIFKNTEVQKNNLSSDSVNLKELSFKNKGKKRSVDNGKSENNKNISICSFGGSLKERIFNFFSSNLCKAFCLFLQNTIPVFDKFNTHLQSEKPLFPTLRSLIFALFKELLSKFMKPEVVKKTSSPIEVDYHSLHNQKSDNEIIIGSATAKIVECLVSEEKKVFFSHVRKYFISILDYIYHSFPHKSDTLINAEVINVSAIASSDFSKLKYFINKFPAIIMKEEDESKEVAIDILQAQFCQLQMDDLPSNIMEESRIDTQWKLISDLKNEMGEKKYGRLAKTMLSLLVIPHSNAECERTFSQIRKIKTDFRASLSNKNLENLLIVKCSKKVKCFEENFSSEFLKKAKSATYLLSTKCVT